ncbi:hypothetical protein APA_4513 [Pseudanabaena sp. lw0831]|nr:hypothetical protein [Pseudanabaena sp. lw0831]GBO56183.1 hypothetical protein APA_4513 [Pseudanabaena sp. lw0831]
MSVILILEANKDEVKKVTKSSSSSVWIAIAFNDRVVQFVVDSLKHEIEN